VTHTDDEGNRFNHFRANADRSTGLEFITSTPAIRYRLALNVTVILQAGSPENIGADQDLPIQAKKRWPEMTE
jgi:hypothetical protein